VTVASLWKACTVQRTLFVPKQMGTSRATHREKPLDSASDNRHHGIDGGSRRTRPDHCKSLLQAWHRIVATAIRIDPPPDSNQQGTFRRLEIAWGIGIAHCGDGQSNDLGQERIPVCRQSVWRKCECVAISFEGIDVYVTRFIQPALRSGGQDMIDGCTPSDVRRRGRCSWRTPPVRAFGLMSPVTKSPSLSDKALPAHINSTSSMAAPAQSSGSWHRFA